MELLVLTHKSETPDSILPALDLLPHHTDVQPMQISKALDAPDPDVILVDACDDLAGARTMCRHLRATGSDTPVVLLIADGGLAVVGADWGADEILLPTAQPAEVAARLRLVSQRGNATSGGRDTVAEEPVTEIGGGDLTIDSGAYAVRLYGKVLDLTHMEFELLRYLAQHPDQVFTRDQLLSEVWGHDYFGGNRTVDVHVRRLRAKLGPAAQQLIGTVRGVGYRFDPHRRLHTEGCRKAKHSHTHELVHDSHDLVHEHQHHVSAA